MGKSAALIVKKISGLAAGEEIKKIGWANLKSPLKNGDVILDKLFQPGTKEPLVAILDGNDRNDLKVLFEHNAVILEDSQDTVIQQPWTLVNGTNLVASYVLKEFKTGRVRLVLRDIAIDGNKKDLNSKEALAEAVEQLMQSLVDVGSSNVPIAHVRGITKWELLKQARTLYSPTAPRIAKLVYEYMKSNGLTVTAHTMGALERAVEVELEKSKHMLSEKVLRQIAIEIINKFDRTFNGHGDKFRIRWLDFGKR